MKDVKKRHLKERAAKKIKEENNRKEAKAIQEIAKKYKSNWREELINEGEWQPVASGAPTNAVTQTFGYFDGGFPVPNSQTGQQVTMSLSGIGLQGTQSSTTIDLGFGETMNVSAPTYNQLAIAGYTPPLKMVRRGTPEDTNPKLDASQQFVQKINADVMMNARVGVGKDLSSEGIKLVSKILGTLGDSRIVKELKTFFDYLNDDLPDKITNEYFSKKHLKSLWSNGFINDKGKFAVNDFIIGSGQRLTYDPNTDSYTVKFNYDFSDNVTEMANNPGKYNNILGRIRAISGGKYGLDALTLPGLLVTAQKAKGFGKGVDGEISISREELLKTNKTLIDLNDIMNPESDGFDTGHGYSSPPAWLDKWARKVEFTGDLRSLWDGKTRTWNLRGKIVDNYGRSIKKPITPKPSKSKSAEKIKSMAKTKRQSLSLDEPFVRVKGKKKEEGVDI